MLRGTLVGSVLVALALTPAPSYGQVVDGVVVDEITGTPLAGVVVVLLDTLGTELARTQSSDVGRFFIRPPAPGRYQLWADRLGYSHVLSEPLGTGRDLVPVEIRLTPLPIALDEVRVTAEARRLALERTGYYRRRRASVGRFLDLEVIEERALTRTTDVLRMEPSVHLLPDIGGGGGAGTVIVFRGAVRGMGPGGSRPCLPSLVIDGTLVRRGGPLPGLDSATATRPIRLDELVHPSEILGIELYPSGAGAPAEFSGTDARCGVVIVWTKQLRP